MPSVRPGVPSLRRQPAWSLVAALVLGVVLASVQYLQSEGRASPSALLVQVAYPLLWWVLAPLVELAERGLHDRARWPLRIAGHVAAGSALGLVHALATWALRASLGTLSPAAWEAGPLRLALAWWPLNLLVYGMVLGAWVALRWHAEARDRQLEASRLEAALVTAQLQALRMQLNPHFLFNTMNAIAMLVRARENDRAVRMLAGLSDLLRTVLLRGGEDLVTLGEELALAERYLALEAERFADRLAVRVEVPDALRAARVPSLLLQPLVENALRHGLGRRPGGGRVEIAACERDGLLELDVRDEGDVPTGPPVAGTGTGLTTTRERLRRRYGDAATLVLEVGPHGAVARVRLPLEPVAAAPPAEGAA